MKNKILIKSASSPKNNTKAGDSALVEVIIANNSMKTITCINVEALKTLSIELGRI